MIFFKEGVGYWSNTFLYFNNFFLEQVVSGNSKEKMCPSNSKGEYQVMKFIYHQSTYIPTYLFISFTWDFWITINEKFSHEQNNAV